jgi:hypothetical protein
MHGPGSGKAQQRGIAPNIGMDLARPTFRLAPSNNKYEYPQEDRYGSYHGAKDLLSIRDNQLMRPGVS